MLPTGQIMFTDFSNDVELFDTAGSPYSGWNPTMLLPNLTMTHGTTARLNGTHFNGASQNNAYGGDFQDATNYPIVRFTNVATEHVFYGKTHATAPWLWDTTALRRRVWTFRRTSKLAEPTYK